MIDTGSNVDFDDLPPLSAYEADEAWIPADLNDPAPLTRGEAQNAAHSPGADAATIARLAGLPDIEYERIRTAEAQRLGVRTSVLDRERTAAIRACSRPTNTDSPTFSDDWLALRFSDEHADRLRYTATFGKWHEWSGTHWQSDETVRVFDLARRLCRDIARDVSGDDAADIASAGTVAAVERLARNDRRHAVTVDQWDADPWLLNTPGGTVDLRTGSMRTHRPADHLSKVTAVTPQGDCPTWQTFLHRVTNGDAEVHDFLQRMAGYCLTGMTSEHALFFAYGTGGNGKSVFINTLAGILKDYAAISGMETFTASQSDRHPTELAMLRGARLVTAQETDEGRRWAEAKIKAMTGGDPITARFMHKDFFTYAPQFKLVIAGNHKPGLRNVDEAIRRRFHLIPFNVKIPAEERDPHLPDKLRAEWPGILAWAIEGCLHWQKIGLAPPAAVTEATDQYLSGEDALGQWIEERCNVAKSLWAQSSALYADWKAWAERNGEFPGSQKRFAQNLIARGFEKHDARHGKGFLGLALQSEIDP